MNQKLFFFILVLALVGTITAWANGSNEETLTEQKDVNLVMWGGLPPENGPQELVNRYMELNPNVDITYIRYVNDDQGNVKLDTALLAGEQIDIFTSYSPARRERRQQSGMAADITDLLTENGVDLIRDFGEGAQPSIMDGRVYSVPTMKIVGFVALNKDMFDEAGIEIPTSWTWNEFRQISKKLTHGSGAGKVYGIIRDYESITPEAMLATKYGRDAHLKDDMSGTLWRKNPDFRRAFQLLHDMMYVDESMISYEDMMSQGFTGDSGTLATAFFQGRSAMMTTGTYMLRNLKDAEKYPREFTVAFAPLPTFDETGKAPYYREVAIYDDMMVNPKSKQKEEAVKFITWYATEGYAPMIKGGRIPLYLKYPADRAAELLLEGAGNLLDLDSFSANVLSPVKYVQESKPGSGEHKAELWKIFLEEREKYYLGVINLDELITNLETRQNAVLNR